MRILYISQKLTPHDHRFLFSLSQTQYKIYFLQLNQHKNTTRLPENIVDITGYFSRFTEASILKGLKKIIIDINPDLIHAGPIQTVAYYPAKLHYKNLITVSWGYDLLLDADQNENSRQLTKNVLQASKILICDCQASKLKAISFGFPEKKIVTFPWGVDLSHFSPKKDALFRKKLGWDKNFIMLSMRSWEPIYGVDVIANAFVKLAKVFPEARLIMAGMGSQEKAVQHIFSENNLLDKVYFAGQVDLTELPQLYSSADLYLSASHVDGSSVSLMEALACGVPVLVSDILSNKEWVDPGKQGWLFKDNDIDDCVLKMKLAISSRNDINRIQNVARKTAEYRADWSKNFALLLGAYQLALA